MTIRSANCTESAMCEPPKPRLITGKSGNDSFKFHIRMLELPTNNAPCFGGGCLRSASSNAAIVFSHCDTFGGSAETPDTQPVELPNRHNTANHWRTTLIFPR